MPNIRLNIFGNYPVLDNIVINTLINTGSLDIGAFIVEGSISFNNVAVIVSQGHTSASVTYSFGLYSLSGSTLSLANSASRAFNTNANGLSWLTLATSVAQDITPGIWYFGFLSSTSGQNSFSLVQSSWNGGETNDPHGGPFFRGRYSTSISSLPASIATSDMVIEGGVRATAAVQTRIPYILISA